jgi:hypothetical protein
VFKWYPLAGLILAVPLIVVSTQQAPTFLPPRQQDNFAFIENQLLSSSRYTQMDEVNQTILDRFTSQYQLRFRQDELVTMGFVKMLENSLYTLYFEKDSFSLILEHRDSGYMLSSRPEFQGFSQTRENNETARNLMNSGLWVETVRTTNLTSSGVATQSLYTVTDVSYVTDGSQDLANLDLTSPYEIVPSSYKRNLVNVTTQAINAQRFSNRVQLNPLGLTFQVDIYLTPQGFGVYFNPSTIEETNANFRLLGLQFFPYFGSTREDVYPGYMVLPDGVGALIRTNRRYDTSFQSDYFGSDLGYGRTSVEELSLPIYGIIHQVGGFGFFNEIISGAENTTMLANFWGRNTRYQRMTNRYNVRRIYRTIINRAGDGRDSIIPNLITVPYDAQYQMLTGIQADYVGIAKQYQANLVANNVLTQKEPEQMPMQIAYMMNEREPTFFGTQRVAMTSPQQAKVITETLADLGIEEQVVVLKGWSEDGLSFRQPYRFVHPDTNGLRDLISYADTNTIPIYLEQDYAVSSELSSRVNFNQDVARSYAKTKMSYQLNRLDNQPIDEYYLYPEVAQDKLNLDLNTIENLGVDGLSLPYLGKTLYSYFNQNYYSRTETKTIFESMADSIPGTAMHRPSSYMFPYLNQYLDVPITNSQRDIYSDLVPLIPLVLKGYTPLFTPYLNFNALGRERLLQMIDFGVNPSYLISEQASALLRFTYSNRYFTTAYSDFAEEMVLVYDFLSFAYQATQGTTVTARTMLTTGVSRIQYDNGVKIYVNYRNQDVTIDGVSISRMDFRVVLP